jgi:hypothetical protein
LSNIEHKMERLISQSTCMEAPVGSLQFERGDVRRAVKKGRL